MATLPASAPLTLATLVTRAKAAHALVPRPAAPSPLPKHRPTLTELERASSLARVSGNDALSPPSIDTLSSTPIALALWITIRKCACGSVTRCPPDYALVKYSLNSHSVHYHRDEIIEHSNLPREIREKEISISVCEACFND